MLQVFGGGGEGGLAGGGFFGFQDDEGEAVEGFVGVADEGFVVGGVAVVEAGDGGGAGEGEVDGVVGVGADVAVFVEDADGDEGEVLAVGGDFGAVGGEFNFGGGSGGGDFIGGDDRAVFGGDGFEGAGGVGDFPFVVDAGHVFGFFFAEGLAVEEEFDGVGVGVGLDGDGFAFKAGPVPGGEEVDHGFGGPLGLVDVEAVFGEAGDIDDAEVGRAGGPAIGGGFADVIEAGPDEFAGDPGSFLHADELGFGGVAPIGSVDVVGGDLVGGADFLGDLDVAVGAEGEAVFAAGAESGGGFRADEDVSFLGGVFGDVVVDAEDVEGCGEAGFEGRFGIVAGGADEACGVFAADDVGEAFGHFTAVGSALFGDFIADAPEDDGGVIAVAVDHGDDIAFGPVVEEAAITEAGLGAFPFVEGFIHDEEAHAVGEVEKFGVWGIVGGADGVAAEGAEDFELSLEGAEVGGGAEGAEVVVIADALDLDAFAVEEEAVVGGEYEGADAEGGGIGVDDFAVHGEIGDDGVEVGGIGGPALWVGDGEGGGEGLGGVGGEGAGGLEGGDLLAAGIEEAGVEGDGGGGGGIVLEGGGGFDRCGGVGDFGGGDVHAPVGDVDGIGDVEADVAIDAGTGVPAGGGLFDVDVDGEGVGFVEIEVGGEVVFEGGVAVGMVAEEFSVEVHVGVHVDAFELDGVAVACVGGGEGVGFAVPGL